MSSSSYKYLYLTFLFLHLTILVTGDSPQPYLPLDNIALDCGSSSESPASDRNWTADINSKVALLDQDNGSIPSAANEASTSTYLLHESLTPNSPTHFPSQQQDLSLFAFIFIRLPTLDSTGRRHLFLSQPVAIPFLATSMASITLSLMVTQTNLNITFTPSPHVADAYAFINGIEIVSMPTNLYYTARAMNDFDKGFHDPLKNETALEMMYRVTVGGAEITPPTDTTDYNNDTRYAAPDALYRTARSMGPNRTVNAEYNMTWEFPVHSTFSYLVRLHFCQIIPIILRKGDLAFEIYIANKTAERYADIIDWAGGNGVPIYKDYSVMMDARGNEEVQNLSIALHPIETLKVFDAMLNGVEIFKLSNSDNLSGPNPGAYEDSPTSATSSKPKLPQQNRFVRQPFQHNTRKDRPICTHCGLLGHTVEKCYKLHGYPPGYRANRNKVNSVFQDSDSQNNMIPQLSISQEQYQQLLALIKPPTPPVDNPASNHQPYRILSRSLNTILEGSKPWLLVPAAAAAAAAAALRILLISESIMNSESKLESAMEYKGRSPSISGSEILARQRFALSSSSSSNNDDDNVRADKERLLIVSLLMLR
uniref:Malectin-like domain-containing protein n=1 Tax=Salix viminalis TaxID=40686 RepID=A0A6N2MET4_SALVM